MAGVKTTLIGFGELQRKFNKLSRQLANKKPMFKGIGIKLLNEINETFQKESFEGNPWERLKPSTINARRKGRGPGGEGILKNTNLLRGSFSPENSETRWLVTRNSVRVGTNVEYAASHEFGIGNPKRQMIPTRKRALEIAIPVARFFLNRSLSRSGLI